VSFLWEIGKLFVEYQLQQASVQAQLNRKVAPVEAKKKPVIPFDPDDVIGENGTNILEIGDIGSGKTNAAGHIVEMFMPMVQAQQLTVAVDDPKGDMLQFLPHGITEMFDAMRAMAAWPVVSAIEGLDPANQAEWFMDDLHAMWKDTIETARVDNHVPWALTMVLENKKNLLWVLDVLRGLRLPTKNAEAKKHWNYVDNELSDTARGQQLESSFNRLAPFVQTPLLRRLIEHKHPWDMYQALEKGGYLYSSLPLYRPLSKKHATYLRMLWLNSLIRTKLHLGDKAPPLLLVLDEAQLVMAHDVGLLQFVLDSGRGLGIHLMCICHTLAQIRKSNPELIESVKQNCQIKIVGRGTNAREYMELAETMYLPDWSSDLLRGEPITRKNGDEEEVVSRQFKEVAVFMLEKAQLMSEHKIGNFTVKVKGREPERMPLLLRERVEHDVAAFMWREDYLHPEAEVTPDKTAWDVRKDAKQKSDAIRNQANKKKRTDLP
jgi:hypothetical protein